MSLQPQADPPTPSGATRYRLIIYRDSSVRTFLLEGEHWVVGRADDCTIRLQDGTASRHHLALERRPDGIYFRDLGGINATLLNGRTVRDGKLTIGATLTVGMTRITLDTYRAQTRVRIDPESHNTRILHRSYIEPDHQATQTPLPAASVPQTRTGDSKHLISVFDVLSTAFSDLGSPEEIASAMLDLALDQTLRLRGLIGVFDVMGRLSVLASVDRTASGSDLHLPAELIESVRARRDPFLTTTVENHVETPERLFAPLGGTPGGLLMLDTPLPDAPKAQDALRIAAALARLVWRRLDEAEERMRLRGEVQRLRTQRHPVQTFLLASARLSGVAQTLRAAARQGLPVYLYGEEGTEKEILARHVHGSSSQTSGPFVSFHTALVPPDRAEEELLGAVGSGHEGTIIGGCLVRAHGGVLYLENPELLPQRAQERLADVLARRLGSGRPGPDTIPIEVRVVSASNEVHRHESRSALPGLRPALAELLQSVIVEIPPLRSEPAEIAPLAELILSEMGPAADGAPRSLTDGARRMLMEYSWPGNLRQLRRALEFAAARAGSQPIAPRFLPPDIQTGKFGTASPIPTLAELERQHIYKVIEACAGNKREAATRLGIAISTLYEKLRKFENEA